MNVRAILALVTATLSLFTMNRASAADVPPIAPRANAEKIPTLIVTGENNHDFDFTSRSMKRVLEGSGKFEVTITTTPSETLADAAALSKYKLILLDYNGKPWSDAANKGFVAAVAGGVNVAVIHAANNAFPGFTEYEKIVGHLWRAGTGHGTYHPFDLTIGDYTHPITRGLGEVRQHPDELYHKLVNAQNVPYTVLATAFSDPKEGGTGQNEPMIMVGQYGKARVFHTPLGHVWRDKPETHTSHEDWQFQRLLVRGCEWAATGDVKDTWIDLFDGKDLKGWTYCLTDPNVKMDQVWSVRDGMIVCKGNPAGYIRTEADYQDYILEVDWQWEPSDKGGRNSGVLVRMTGKDMVWPKSLEAQLESDSAGDFWQIEEFPVKTAADRKNGRNTKRTHAGEHFEKPIGEWNHYRITVDHGTVVLSVNGTILNEGSEADRVKGHICLQSEGAEIHFKNVRLLPLDG